MTYPQQPYGGQQPDPYGQGQQPGQYGGGYQQTPPGGYQQPTGQYPGYDQTAQYGGYPGGQYGGGYGGPPPPKKNTGMIVAVVAIVVLVLGGLGFTGFVAPGFFLSDDKKNAGSGGDTTTSQQPEGAAADEFIDELVKAADGQDASALKGMACDDAKSNVDSAIEDISEITGATLSDTEEVSDSEVTAKLAITVNGEDEDYDATVVKSDGSKDWCWDDIERTGTGGGLPTATGGPATTSEAPPTGGGSGGSGGDGEDFVQGFLDAVNSGDGAGAKSKLCSDSTSQGDVDDAITGKANLEMDTSGMESQEEYVGVDLKGTLNGAPTSAARTSAFVQEGGWCIFTFYAF